MKYYRQGIKSGQVMEVALKDVKKMIGRYYYDRAKALDDLKRGKKLKTPLFIYYQEYEAQA